MRPFLLLTGFLAVSSAATAHEFWLSPTSYQTDKGAPISADIRVGQDFKGAAYSYIPRDVTRHEAWTPAAKLTPDATVGDRPALQLDSGTDGLHILVHETGDNRLTYTEWKKFLAFADHKAFIDVPAQHAARGLPQTDFVESYRRYAKSLVASGSGKGADRNVGHRIEIIARANPYTDDLSAGLPVDVLLDGAKRANTQVEVFEKAPDDSVTVTLHQTDASGRAVIPVKPGYRYLLDNVALESTGNDDPTKGPVWHTIWASLTFAVPE